MGVLYVVILSKAFYTTHKLFMQNISLILTYVECNNICMQTLIFLVLHFGV